ncbi:MAG TPA: UMP kinase [Candidatus Paceibacterota bacterium]
MRYKFGSEIIIGLGGSIICPDGVSVPFLRKFQKFARALIKSGRSLIIVVGGGGVTREYQGVAGVLARVTDRDKDWIGIHATRLNAQLLRTIFRDVANPVIWDNAAKVKRTKHKIVIASGWHPGWSTDYVAFAIADKLKIKEVVVAGKPDFVYASDPVKNPSARKFERMDWKEYRKLIPEKWDPGMHAPVDPVAARLAARKNINAIVVDGRDLKNFGKLLRGGEFRGTIIR